ncbi:MAG: DUF4153 domain-containing protein [Lachnospiraceae bacterium]|nr:DUF4153 domain-containing protein [Lachnospiraceae bacterium]
MERFRSFLKKAFSYPELLYGTHRVTTVSVIAAALLFAVYTFLSITLNMSSVGMEIFFCFCISCVFFAAFALCLESIRPGWTPAVRSICWAVSAAASLVMGFILLDTRGSHRAWANFIDSAQDRLGWGTIAMYLGGISALLVLTAIYFSYSHDVHQAFARHFINVNSKLFFTGIIYGVIQLGVLFLTLIVMVLLYDDAFDLLPTILVLVNGLFLAPAALYAITHENEDANQFFEALVRYVMLTITLIAFSIIYIYIIKLVVTASVPSNSVYAILTALFIVSMYISYMSSAYEEKGFLQKFAYNCPLVFAPFVIMQCYTVFVRIGQYGLTPKRYFGIAFILFELVYIIYYTAYRKLNKETPGRNILLIICAFIILTVFLPGINARAASFTAARRSLSSYLDAMAAGGATSKQCLHANAAYDVLSGSDFGSGKLGKYFPDLDASAVKSLREQAKAAASELADEEDENSDSGEKYGFFSCDIMELAEADGIDISGYSRMKHVSIRDAKKDRYTSKKACDSTKLAFRPYWSDTSSVSVGGESTIDLSSFTEEFIKLCSEKDDGIIEDAEFDRLCRGLCIVETENARIYITDADITRNKDNEPLYINLEAYVFEK